MKFKGSIGYGFLLALVFLPFITASAVPPSPLHSPLASIRRAQNRRPVTAAIFGRKRRNRKRVAVTEDDDDDDEEELTIRRPKKKPKRRGRQLWPPWPFNLLQAKPEAPPVEDSYDVPMERKFRSAPLFMWLFARESTRATLDKMRQVASQLWFHLPPGMPPFVLVAMVPRTVRQTATSAAEGVATTADAIAAETVKRAIPLVANPFARSVALSGLGLAIMSWAHYEIHRKRCLTPLPLAAPYRDLYKSVLPPFLPEEIPANWIEEEMRSSSDQGEDDDDDEDVDSLDDESKSETISESVRLPPTLQKNVNSILGLAPTPRSLRSTLREWQRMRIQRERERRRAHRLSIQDQLLALQAIKSRAAQRKRPSSFRKAKAPVVDENGRLGYALVTGASRGIGRAIAVELARYEIPLILVARDVDRLTALAYDLESCYGIRCCIIAADLSKPGEAEKIHRATNEAGLKVDILVNNAGYSLQGQSVEFAVEKTNNMIQLNAMSVSALTHLYGKDMKDRRRGRILMISSICGAVAGIPTVSVYAATKAFVNALSLSIAQELEPYGVGVTCAMPGAVKETAFKARSATEQALCWKIPYYAKSPQQVAESSIKALLRGETECTPGWENRFFLKVVKPAIPVSCAKPLFP